MVIPFLKPEYKNIRWLQTAHPAFIQLSGSREIPDLVWENNIYNLFFKTVIFILAVKLNVLACTPPVFSKLIWDLWCSGVSDNSWSHLMFLVFDFFGHFKNKSPSTSVVQENSATLFCCWTSRNVLWRSKLPPTFPSALWWVNIDWMLTFFVNSSFNILFSSCTAFSRCAYNFPWIWTIISRLIFSFPEQFFLTWKLRWDILQILLTDFYEPRNIKSAHSSFHAFWWSGDDFPLRDAMCDIELTAGCR